MKKFLKSGTFLVIFAVLIGIYGLFIAQHMEKIGSMGDDSIYGSITKDFPTAVFGKKLDDYRLKRVLPLGIVHYSLKIFSIPLTFENIALTFGVYHVLLLGLLAFLWNLIAKELAISIKGRWLGFVALFLNYHFLKHIPLIQITTDVFAYTSTLALLFFYLKNNIAGMMIMSFIGAFSWPTVLHMGVLLMLFPRDEGASPLGCGCRQAPLYLNYVVSAALIGFVLYQMKWILHAFSVGRIFRFGIFSMGANRPLLSLVYLSIAIVVTYLFWGMKVLLKGKKPFSLRYLLKKMNFVRGALVVVLLLGIKGILLYASARHNARPLDYLVKNLLMTSVIQPGAFIVTHIMFFGPILIFAFFRWSRICQLVRSYGAGLIFCFILIVLFSIDSESRKQMNTYALLVPFLIKVLDGYQWRPLQIGMITILSLLVSRVWLFFPQGWQTGNILEFPMQYYGMSVGPWMSHKMYGLQLIIVTTMVLLIYLFIVRNQKINEPLNGK